MMTQNPRDKRSDYSQPIHLEAPARDERDGTMPPAAIMDPSDPFSQFGQLTLDSQPSAPAPATPPPASKTDVNVSGMAQMNATGGYQYQYPTQQMPMQQPMQVSPDQPANPSNALVQQPQQPTYANYQHNVAYGQPAPPMQQMPPQAMQQALTSPPISPLWNPTSPEGTPPQAANNAALPPMPAGGAPVPALSPASPNQPVAAPAANPFDMFAPAPPAPAAAPPADPFATTQSLVSGPAPHATTPPSQQPQDDDFWGSMGFDAPTSNQGSSGAGNVTPGGSEASLHSGSYGEAPVDDKPVELDDRGLPAGGEYYSARVTTPLLGAIFSSARELRSTLFKAASDSFVEAIGDRPVISFTIDGSAADTAGICLGHVLLKVNGQDVSHTDEAVKTVGSAARPMTLEFYIPSRGVEVVKTEGMCMVKYDNHSTEAPPSAIEWKAKYVVVGDMLGKPHIIYMYRSKAEYDIAVKESQTRNRALSVKVKQFDLRGARIFHERGTVRYPNKPRWHYFTLVRPQGLPIKISASSAEALRPILDGVSAFLEKEARAERARMEEDHERQMNQGGLYSETYY